MNLRGDFGSLGGLPPDDVVLDPDLRNAQRNPWNGVRDAAGGARRLPHSRYLLELDGGAGLFELRLDLVGLFLRRAFLDRVRRAVDEVLGLLQAQARDRADDLDHLDLLVAGAGEHDVERGLLLRSRPVAAGSRSTARGRNRDRSGSAD